MRKKLNLKVMEMAGNETDQFIRLELLSHEK